MAVNVKSFKQPVFDPIVLNKTTGYFYEVFIRHCLCFEVIGRTTVFEKNNHTFGLGYKHEDRSFQAL